MKYLYLVLFLFLCVCVPALATEPISPPVPYPANVDTMTYSEFYWWATAKNKEAQEAWDAAKAAQPPQYIYNPVVVTESVTSIQGSRRSGVRRGVTYQRSRAYNYRTVNPNYSSPGPLTIINPYCNPTQIKK